MADRAALAAVYRKSAAIVQLPYNVYNVSIFMANYMQSCLQWISLIIAERRIFVLWAY